MMCKDSNDSVARQPNLSTLVGDVHALGKDYGVALVLSEALKLLVDDADMQRDDVLVA